MKIKTRNLRWLVQLSILAFITLKGVEHQVIGGGPEGVASIHALCPFGGIESFYSLITSGEFIKKTFYSNIILLIGSSALVLVLGRIFCGWICALGTLQDAFEKIGKKIFKKRYQVPKKLDSVLRYLKYIVLIGIIYLTWKTGTLIINDLDPFAAYSHISAGWEELLGEYIIGFSILIVMLITSLLYDRLFCRYICPLGAYYALLGKISIFKINRNKSTCISCNMCNKECPAGLDIAKSDKVNNSECLGCMKCISICPTKVNSLETKPLSNKLSGKSLGLAGIGIYFGIIILAKGVGIYQTNESDISKMLDGNPNNIRGWMTIQSLSDEFEIPLKDIYSEIGVTQSDLPPETSLKNSESLLEAKGIEFDHDRINESIALILGVDLDHEEVNRENTEGIEFFELKGSMTINTITEKSGLTSEKVIEKLILPEDIPHNEALKDLSSKYGFEMSDIKERWEK